MYRGLNKKCKVEMGGKGILEDQVSSARGIKG